MDDILCPMCGEVLEECHPYSSDAGRFWYCFGCDVQYDEYEVQELIDDQEE